MAIAALQTILDRIDTWPPERQETAAELLASLEAQDDDLQVSDEDLAEIDRRIADVNAPTMSLEEFRVFVDQLLKR
jgi:hypothetical protein